MSIAYNPSIVTDGLVLCLDAANPKSYSPNVFPKPTDIYGWVNTSSGNACTLSRDTITSPVGNTPMKMAITGNDPYTPTMNVSTWNLAPIVTGQTWTMSVWVKASIATTIEMFMFAAQSNSTWANAGGDSGYYNPSVTTEWTRLSMTTTFTNATATYIQVRLDGTNASGSGINIWWDGLQVERVSTPSTFTSKYNPNGDKWYDTISSTVALITNRPNWTPGKMTFDGSSSVATITYDSKFNFNYGQTIGILLRPTENDAVRRNPYNQAYGGGGTITHETTGQFNYYCGTAGSNTTPYMSASSNMTVAQNEMAYITVSRDPQYVRWYKNGVLDTTTPNAYGTMVTGTSDILIGSGYAGSWMGDICAVHLYTRGISPIEVMQNFNAIRSRYSL